MIALAFLFALIISMLWIIVYLLEKYFDAYRSVYTSEKNGEVELQNRLDMHKNSMKNCEVEKQIDAIIDRRLSKLEQKFPDSEIHEESAGNPIDMLTKNVKQLFHSALNLLSSEHNNEVRR